MFLLPTFPCSCLEVTGFARQILTKLRKASRSSHLPETICFAIRAAVTGDCHTQCRELDNQKVQHKQVNRGYLQLSVFW
jgi:hypothetical protein